MIASRETTLSESYVPINFLTRHGLERSPKRILCPIPNVVMVSLRQIFDQNSVFLRMLKATEAP